MDTEKVIEQIKLRVSKIRMEAEKFNSLLEEENEFFNGFGRKVYFAEKFMNSLKSKYRDIADEIFTSNFLKESDKENFEELFMTIFKEEMNRIFTLDKKVFGRYDQLIEDVTYNVTVKLNEQDGVIEGESLLTLIRNEIFNYVTSLELKAEEYNQYADDLFGNNGFEHVNTILFKLRK